MFYVVGLVWPPRKTSPNIVLQNSFGWYFTMFYSFGRGFKKQWPIELRQGWLLLTLLLLQDRLRYFTTESSCFHHFWWFIVWIKNKGGRVKKRGRVSPKTWWVFILTWSVLCILQIMSVDWMKFWLKRFKSSLNWEVRFFLLILDFVI